MRESNKRFKGKQQMLKTKITVMNNASPGRRKPKQGNGTNTEKCNSTEVPKIKKKKKKLLSEGIHCIVLPANIDGDW